MPDFVKGLRDIKECSGAVCSSCEGGYRRFKLVRGLQKLKNGFFFHRCGIGGVRLKYGG
jgi:hypothetical protein